LHPPDKYALQSFVFCRFGAIRSSSTLWAYLQFVDAHLPRSKKAHIFVLDSCIVTALSLIFVFFSLTADSGELAPMFVLAFGDLPIFPSALIAPLVGSGSSRGEPGAEETVISDELVALQTQS
jgi:hypothetical protein